MAGGPDLACALVKTIAIKSPEPQDADQILLQIPGSREAGIAHQQPAGVDEVAILGLFHRQEPVDGLPVGGMERMTLFLHSAWFLLGN